MRRSFIHYSEAMKKLRRIIKNINIAIAKVLFTIAYVVIIMPYKLFVRKPGANWAKPEQSLSDLTKMW